jgi:hypothetical protein
MFPSAQKNYDSQMPAESPSDDSNYKDEIFARETAIKEEVIKEVDTAAEIFEIAACHLSKEQSIFISRAVQSRDATALMLVLAEMIESAVRREAENRRDSAQDFHEMFSDFPMIVGRQA